MKKKIKVTNGRGEYVEKEIQYIPVRYILAMMITILEVVMVIGLVFLFAYYSTDGTRNATITKL